MKFVQVQGWDCCPTTHSIWYHPDLPKKTKFTDLGIMDNQFDNDHDPENLIKELKKQGFKLANCETLTYGGNY